MESGSAKNGLKSSGSPPTLNAAEPLGVERVLVVDDDPGVTEVIAATLEPLGYEVKTVVSADLALADFERIKPDVLISDWLMPGMNGIELVTILKQRDPVLAAILITGYGTKETVIQAFTQGKINYFLSKPFQVKELIETVSAAVKERKLSLSEKMFRLRLEHEIQSATRALEDKNRLLEHKNQETDHLLRELRMRQEEVEGTKNYLENLLESSVDAIVSADGRRRLSFFSLGAEEMFGYRSGDVLGRPLRNLFPSDRNDLGRLLRKLKAHTGVKHFEAEMLKKNGRPMVVDISAAHLRRQPGDAGLLLIIKDIADRKRLEEELKTKNLYLEKISVTDGLTGLFNHLHFHRCLHDEFQRARRFGTSLSLIMLDLDDFKLINDTYGHQIGDQVLILLAELIRECVREVDTAARYGGEEFAIVLPQTDVADAVVVATRLKETIEKTPRFPKIYKGLKVTASLGLAGYPEADVHSPQDLIRYADKALYRAKEIGKNRVVLGGAAGDRPLGRGEHLTQSEKKAVLRRIAETLKGRLDLDQVLTYTLKEIAETLPLNGNGAPCSIMIMEAGRGLRIAAEQNITAERRRDFDVAAHLAAQKKAVHSFPENAKHGPTVSFPILLDRPEREQEILGVVNLGLVPSDLDFIKDILNQAALGILNAKLYRELELAKTSLEKKVNQLLALTQMDMNLQRQGVTKADFEAENKKLLANSLVRIGFERVWIFNLDPESSRIQEAVSSDLAGVRPPEGLALSDLGLRVQTWLSAAKEAKPATPVEIIKIASPATAAQRRTLRRLGFKQGELAVTTLLEGEAARGIILAAKETVLPEDLETLTLFGLHAGLITQNLKVTRLYQDKARRLSLLHDLGLKLAWARSIEERSDAISAAVSELTKIMGASEISVYTVAASGRSYELAALASNTASPGREPARMIKVEKAVLMTEVLNRALKTGRAEPMIDNDLKKRLGRRLRKRFSTTAYLGTPIMAGGRVVGLLNVTDKLDGNPFTPADAELAQITSGILAAFINPAGA
ncbi:MAG: diguanylate cyclase [Thermodesulfobacteriota bacterium]